MSLGPICTLLMESVYKRLKDLELFLKRNKGMKGRCNNERALFPLSGESWL